MTPPQSTDFTKHLRKCQDMAWTIPTKHANCPKGQYKNYNLSNGQHLPSWVWVQIYNAKILGKQHLVNTWEDPVIENPVYLVVEQPHKDIPVFVVNQGDDKRNWVLCTEIFSCLLTLITTCGPPGNSLQHPEGIHFRFPSLLEFQWWSNCLLLSCIPGHCWPVVPM